MSKALVMSGGGCKGAFTCGTLKHLIGDLNYSYDIICGVSVGALNSAVLSMYPKEQVQDALKRLLEFWDSIDDSKIYKNWFPFGIIHCLWLKSFYNSQPLIDLVKSNVDLNKIRASGIKTSVGAVSLSTGLYRSFTPDDDNFVDAILASAAVPPGLKPIEIEGQLYTDGGIKHITPLKEAIDFGADEIDVILCCPSPENRTTKYDDNSTTINLALRAVDLMSDQIIDDDLKMALLYNKIVSLDTNSDKRFIKMNIYRPSFDLIDNSLDFSPEKRKYMMDIGYKDAVSKN